MGLLDPTAAEALAAFQAVQLCKDLVLTHIILEGDAKLVVDAVKVSTHNWCRFGQMIDDIRTVLHSFIQ